MTQLKNNIGRKTKEERSWKTYNKLLKWCPDIQIQNLYQILWRLLRAGPRQSPPPWTSAFLLLIQAYFLYLEHSSLYSPNNATPLALGSFL